MQVHIFSICCDSVSGNTNGKDTRTQTILNTKGLTQIDSSGIIYINSYCTYFVFQAKRRFF